MFKKKITEQIVYNIVKKNNHFEKKMEQMCTFIESSILEYSASMGIVIVTMSPPSP